jgi:DNA (cytosine-5)-methyltransferase 1
MAEAHLDQAPIWDDLKTFDGEPWRGRVDCITAGFPCQPFSLAGSQKGVNDERWLWPAIERIICSVGPRFVFLENVPQLVRGGLPFVLADLAELGFDAEWGLHSAAEVGAPHKRERFWLLAYAPSFDEREPNHEERAEPRCDPRGDTGRVGQHLGNTTGSQPTQMFGSGYGWTDPERASGRSGIKPAMGDTSSERRSEVTGSSHGYEAAIIGAQADSGSDSTDSPSQVMADTDGPRSEGYGGIALTNGQKFPDASCGGSDVWPPGRDGNWADYIAKGGPEPSIRRGTDGPPIGMADSLHLGGNGLVPAVAAAAFVELYRRLMSDS